MYGASRGHLRAFIIILLEELEGLEDWLRDLHALRPEASADFELKIHLESNLKSTMKLTIEIDVGID